MVVIFNHIDYMPGVENTKFQTLIADMVDPDHNINRENGVWSLPNGFFMEEERPKSINIVYVRSCAEDLLVLIEEAHQDILPVLLSGVSGCGKTILRNYILQDCLMRDFEDHEYKRTVIVQQGGKNPHLLITITQTGCEVVPHEEIMGAEYVRYTADATVSYLREPVQLSFMFESKTYYLVDCSDGHHECIADFDPALHKVVLFSSPNVDLENDYVTKKNARKYFIPLWTLEELLAARARIPSIAAVLSVDTVVTRFKQVGGVPRYVLNTVHGWYDMQITRDIPNRIEAMDVERILPILGGRVATAPLLLPRTVTHLKVSRTETGDFDYGHATPVWGTKFMATLVAARFAENIRVRLQSESRLHFNDEDPLILKNLVEAYCINQLEANGLCGLEVNESTAGGVICFPLLRQLQNGFFGKFPVHYVSDDAEMDAALLYHGPDSRRMIVPTQFNYPAIDAVLVIGQKASRRYIFVQVTLPRPSETDPSAAARLHQMIALCGGYERAALACMAPASVYHSFHYRNGSVPIKPSVSKKFPYVCIPNFRGHFLRISL